MTNITGAEIGLWDEEDQFYYDELNFPDGRVQPLSSPLTNSGRADSLSP